MIVTQILFGIAIMIVCFKFLAAPNSNQTKAWKKILLMLLLVFALIAVFFPNVTNDVAHLFGIGRGADLLLYTLTVAFLFGELNRYVKQKEEQRKIVTIARKIAIMEANERYR